MGFKEKKAFGLPEIILTILIVGFVTFFFSFFGEKINKNTFAKKDKIFKIQINKILSKMDTENKLGGHKNTDSFVRQLQKYSKIKKTCNNIYLKDCFSSNFSHLDKIISADDIKTSKTLGKKYNTKNIGVIFNNGITAIISYNNIGNCASINKMSKNEERTLNCVGIIYDLNGNKKPNILGKDIRFINASYNKCDGVEYDGLCIAKGINGYNNWSEGKEICNAKGMRLPTTEEIYKMDEYKLLDSGFYWTQDETNTTNKAIGYWAWAHNIVELDKNAKGINVWCVK